MILAVAALSACGSSSSQKPSQKASSASSEAGLAEATEKVMEAEKPISFEPPTEPVEMSKNKGKTIWYIAPSLEQPFVVTVSKGVEAAAQAAGMSAKVFDGKGQADLFNQGVSEAVSQHASAIILQAIPPEVVSGPLAQAKAQKIIVIDSFNRAPSDPLPKNIDGQVTLDYPQSGRTMADYIAVHSKGTAKVGIVTWAVYPIYKELVPAFEEELSKVCPNCSTEAVKSVSPTSPATELQNVTSTMLAQHPTMNYLAPVSDNLATGMIPAVEASGSSGTKIVSVDGDAANLEHVEKSEVEIADVSDPPLEAVGWAQVDQIGRLLLGMPAAEQDTDLPTQLFTTDKIPSGSNKFPGYEGYEEKYEEIWGM